MASVLSKSDTKLLFFLKPFLWLPSFLYAGLTSLRNWLYDSGYIKVSEPDVFSIGIGNLAVGGTGKTPLTNYLIHAFSGKKIAVLSRGYGRKTKGYRKITVDETPETVGDEIRMLFDINHERARFFVCENRVEGVRKIKEDFPEVQIILFDDVFQHRAIKPAVQLLLSTQQRPFYSDYILPVGRLRETAKGARRAQALIVTKCTSFEEYFTVKEESTQLLNENVPVFGCFYRLEQPINISGKKIETKDKAKVLSGLANNDSFAENLQKTFTLIEQHFYPDHHAYTETEIRDLLDLDNFPVITTEKDFIKLRFLNLHQSDLERFYVVSQTVSFYEESDFLSFIHTEFKRFGKEKG
jgi:tetraacyldisaccharide 4'-kinase